MEFAFIVCLRFDALISATTLAIEAGEEEFNSMEPVRFWNIGVYTYVLLNENSSIESIHQKFPQFYEKYMKLLGDQFNASFDLETTKLHTTRSSLLLANKSVISVRSTSAQSIWLRL